MTGPPSGGPVGFSAVCPGFINRVGILGRVEDEIEIPPALGTMPPEAVGAAVVKAIVENKPELIVNKRPIRPIVILASVAPKAAIRLAERINASEMSRRYAATRNRL